MKIETLEAIPRKMVGDGKAPNVYFVSTLKDGVILITRDFQAAYDYWRNLPKAVHPILEDRQTGVLGDCEQDENEEGKHCGPIRRRGDTGMLSKHLRRPFIAA